jgi:hypothetical protein
MKCENFNYSTESILNSVMKSGFEREIYNEPSHYNENTRQCVTSDLVP